MENSELIKILENHVREIEAIKKLSYGNYSYEKANELLQRTKMFSDKYFALKHYGIELIGIRFEPLSISSFTTTNDFVNAWNGAIIKLYSIAKAMLDDARLTPVQNKIQFVEDSSRVNELMKQLKVLQQEKELIKQDLLKQIMQKNSEYIALKLKFSNFKKWFLFIFLLFILSILLWSFNSFVKWNWLSEHPKKIALYITFQLLIIFSLLRIVTHNKAIKIIDILIALVIAILSLI